MHLSETTQEIIKSRQTDTEVILVKVITAPAPFPSPGRALRNLVARCLVLIYTRGETRSLFDTLGIFLKVAAEYKAVDRDVNKM